MAPLRPAAGLGAILGTGLAASLLSALPAQAVTPPASCASFANSTNQVSGATIFGTPSFACQIGDKIYSNFSILADVQDTFKSSGFGFSNAAEIYSLSVTPGFGFRPVSTTTNVGTVRRPRFQTTYSDAIYSLGYTISVVGPRAIKDVSTSATSSVIGKDVPMWTKTLVATSSTETLGPVGLTASQTPPPNGTITVGGPVAFLAPPTSVAFTSTLKVNGIKDNGVFNFNDTITQTTPQAPPTDSVPGPLPVLGAGAAFGFSRRLRRRLRQAKGS